MIVDAWYMVSEFKLNLGPSDNLEKAVLLISNTTKFRPTEKEEVLLAYLRESEDKDLTNLMKVLSQNVPYRLQAPLLPAEDAKPWYKTKAIAEYINGQDGIMYIIEHNGPFNSRIIIDE